MLSYYRDNQQSSIKLQVDVYHGVDGQDGRAIVALLWLCQFSKILTMPSSFQLLPPSADFASNCQAQAKTVTNRTYAARPARIRCHLLPVKLL